MDLVKMGREWVIKTVEEYEEAMKILDGNDFCAEMSDDFSAWKREKAEVARQRASVKAQAVALGII